MQHKVDREISGMRYQVRVLTLQEIDAWYMAIMAAGEKIPLWKRWLRKFCGWLRLAPRSLPDTVRTPVDIMLFDGFALFDLHYLTTLGEAKIRRLTPNQVRLVWAECRELNQDFFEMRRRLETVGMASPNIFAASSNSPLPV